jgi:phosphopantetheinyl transferase
LGGRLAAKEALARAGVSARDSADAGPLSVLAGENRAPYVRGRPGTNVSISHSYEYAVAVVAPFRIGVDLEKIEPRPASLAEYFCSPAERRRLATGCGSKEESDALITFLWSRKEALAKFFEEGGRLPFSALDTLEDIVRVEGRVPSGVRLVSGTADGYCITIAL